MRKTIVLLSIIFSCGALASNDNTGTMSGTFLKLTANPRSAAMGEAQIAAADENSAIFWNPAGISGIKTLSVSSMYSNWLAAINYQSMSLVAPLGKSSIGFAINSMNLGEIEETTLNNPAGTGRKFSPSNYVFTASFSNRLNRDLSFGFNGKIINETIDASTLSGFGADLGLKLKRGEKVSFGFCARNIAGSLGKKPLSSNYGLGLAFQLPRFLVSADLNIPNDNQSTFHIGLEAGIKDVLFGRIGYNTRIEENSGGAVGVGIGLKWKMFKFDYAYVPYGDLGITHRFAFSFMPFFEKIQSIPLPQVKPMNKKEFPNKTVKPKTEPVPKFLKVKKQTKRAGLNGKRKPDQIL